METVHKFSPDENKSIHGAQCDVPGPSDFPMETPLVNSE